MGFSFTEWGLPALGSAQAPRMAEKTEPAYRLVRLSENCPGYQRFLPDAMLAVVVVLSFFVQAIQSLGDWAVRRLNHR